MTDEVQCVGREEGIYPHSHPRILEAVARLNGWDPPAAENCRVLELACRKAANLLPMTQSLPNGRFVGADPAAERIAEGQRVAAAAGIENLELRVAGILDVCADWGEFDYIICHGVYSRAAPEVQHAILGLCHRHLAPCGVAYVSYDTLPGWCIRGLVRELSLYYLRVNADRALGAEAAAEMLYNWQQALQRREGDLALLLCRQLAEALQEPGEYLDREFLAECHEPLYFHEFVRRAAAAGLQYAGEARVETMAAFQDDEMQQRLSLFSRDLLQQEQYRDFIVDRLSRQTLLCRADTLPAHDLSLARWQDFWVVAHALPISPIFDYYSPAPVRVHLPDRTQRMIADPLLKTLLLCLREAGSGGIQVATLWRRFQMRLAHVADRRFARLLVDPREMLATLRDSIRRRYADLSLFPPNRPSEVPEMPLAPALFRQQAASGHALANLRHQPVSLQPADRVLLEHCDGKHDRQSLLEQFAAIRSAHPDWFLEEEAACRSDDPSGLADLLEQRLQVLAGEALLVAR